MGASASLPVEIQDPFSVGVRLALVVEELNKNQLPDDATTTMFCERVIMPVTKQYECSMAEYLRVVRPEAIGKPVGFISHAWKYNIKALVAALVSYFGEDAYVWLDFVCNNQHKGPKYQFEWWSGTFKKAISSIGKTVMVLAPWNDPIPLTRGWCIWELYCTIDNEGCEFDIAMTPESEDCFVKDMDTDPLRMIKKMLATINCESSECFKVEDKNQIHNAIKQTMGFKEMNKKVFEAIRGWVIQRYKKEVEKRKARLGEDHPETLTSFNSLAILYENQGDYKKALFFHETCLKKRKAVLGEDHQDTLVSLNNLAELCCIQRDFTKALTLYEECLKKSRLTLGEEHPSTLTSLNNLAILYRNQQEYDKALPLFEECLKKRKAVLGEDHPSTITSLNNLAVLYSIQDDLDSALPLYKQCLEKSKAVLGDSHPDTVTLLSNLAGLYENQGNHTSAIPLYEECLEKRTALFGENHFSTLASLNNLAGAYCSKKDYSRALPLYEDCLKKCKHYLGENHPHTLSSLHGLASIYNSKGEFATALPLLEECLAKRKSVLGKDHPDTEATQSEYNDCVTMLSD
jgi:tetratricopeptide (TPR) repeat protein